MRPLLFALLLFALPAHAQQTDVLFIGNSYIYSNDLPAMLRQVALSLGDTVNTSMVAPGGQTLMGHADAPATLAAIASQAWDYVVLQEQSQLGALPTSEGFTDVAAASLAYTMQGSSECAYPVFYMTWGRKFGDAPNCTWYPPVCTYAGMQQELRNNYTQLALDNEGYVSPVGVAWQQVRAQHPGIELYQPDESHPSVAGTYLAACVFYCTLFRQSCVGASFTSTVPPANAAVLQAIASSTVLDGLDTWNLNEPGSTDARVTSMSSDVWSEVTLHHFGQGEHLWTCSNGQSSTESNPTFTFDADGTYTFTHTYTDPCGHTDTHTWTFQVYATSIGERSGTQPSVTATHEGLLTITDTRQGDVFEVFDAQGRLVRAQQLHAGTSLIFCPSGLALWRMTAASGDRWNGKVVVP